MSGRDLLASATPRPWPEAVQAVYDDDSGPWSIEGVIDTGGYDGWFQGGVETGPDAALIVAAVNEYEALLDIAEAVEGFRLSLLRGSPRWLDTTAGIALDAALARLDSVRSAG